MSVASTVSKLRTKPRLGFLGLGWIGLHRLKAIAGADCADIVCLADPVAESVSQAQHIASDARVVEDLDELLGSDLDGIVIATPSALHADQARQALQAGTAVFCQKPLGRNAEEVRTIVNAARNADRLLAVDLSYRFVAGAKRLRDWVQSGDLGEIFAIEATFHNAYGPSKPWFFDRAMSGGGCLLDLGIHLVDLVLWIMDWPGITPRHARFYSKSKPLAAKSNNVETFATAQLELQTGADFDLACSWNLPLGRDAQIEVTFFGSRGGATFKNVNGSFFDFTLEHYIGTKTEKFDAGDESWFGAAAADWARRLYAGEGFDPESERLIDVAATLDGIYAQGGVSQ
jgi:predicted dehydrogenase